MKLQKLSILLASVLILVPHILEARQAQTMTFDASTSLILQEFTALLAIEEDEIRVRLQMSRSDNESGEDRLETGDVILMMNGKRATDIETLRSIYEGIEDSEEIKIGVRRGEERFIMSAKKGDVPEGHGNRQVMSFETDVEGVAPVMAPELGSVLLDREEKIAIERILEPLLPDALKSENIQGYFITSLNGNTYESAQDLVNALSEIEVGDEISLELEKDGDEKSITFSKAEPRGNFSISTGN